MRRKMHCNRSSRYLDSSRYGKANLGENPHLTSSIVSRDTTVARRKRNSSAKGAMSK